MKKLLIIVWGMATGSLFSTSAHAWSDNGHKVVSRMAWEYMTPQARAKVIALLMSAPADADLANLLATDARPLVVREREFFLRASTWADMVRDGKFPARREKYHKSPWHYINFFWESAPEGRPRDRTDMKPEPENVVERLHYFQTVLADTSQERSQRAIALAWVLHLVGDIHQPLHNTARVTATEPEGDRGGNLFALDTTATRFRNLHSFWDGILSLAFTREQTESEETYVERVAQLIMTRHPMTTVQARLGSGEFETWAQEGHETAKFLVYPPSLRRYEAPSEHYRQSAYAAAEQALALAGYRLAEMLNRLFAS